MQLETLRLISPIIAIPKYTKDRSQLLNINGHSHIIPPDTLGLPNVFVMHTDPHHWGEDSLVWRPSRWLTHEPCDTQPGGQCGSLVNHERALTSHGLEVRVYVLAESFHRWNLSLTWQY